MDSSNIATQNEMAKRTELICSFNIASASDMNMFHRLCLEAKHQAVAAVDCIRPV
ncbi:unnamed protein product [Eruca vesicaria subsp. sativa]|uniref:Uncharacterized protein n=1 Tax=Eruca vesicaria subsp. sativa TaxID=29727 RepID=A0ABC8M2G6_ERUVS|nr:unnamed protein product [Eruca vesicaria subsp. sativa]